MNDKPVILLIEDSPDAAEEFKDEIKKQIDLQVIVAAPPTNLLELPLLITEHHADAVILDHILQGHSDVTYMGIDAYELLQNSIPSLPLYIVTEYAPGPELNELPTGYLIRKRDFFEDERFQKTRLQELYQATQSYRQGQKELGERERVLRELWAKSGITQELVNCLAELHFEADNAIEQIIWVAHEKEIRLLEVNRTAIPSGTVLVFRFAPSEDLPFPIFIADVTPLEWEQIQRGQIPLPEGWDLATAQIFQRFEHSLKGK